MPRREHKKSRLGCTQCKARRVKCSEDGPPCRNCMSRSLACHYATPQQPAQSPEQQERHAFPTAWAIPSQRHLLELELMHYYTSETWQTFCHNHRQGGQRQQEEQVFLRSVVPQQALPYEFARHAIFSLSALHIAASSSDPTRRSSYIRSALQYQSSAQTGFAAALHDFPVANGEVLFATSLAFLILAIAVPRYLDFYMPQPDGDPFDDIIMANRLYRGSNDLLTKSRLLTPSLTSARLFSPKDMTNFDECGLDTKTALDRLRSISKPIQTRGPTDKPDSDLIDELEFAFRRLQAGNMTVALGWLLSAPESFISDLMDRDTAASLIFLHWCVLLHLTSQLWWVPSSGPAMVVRLSKQLLDTNQWDTSSIQGEALTWCLQQVKEALPTSAEDEASQPSQ